MKDDALYTQMRERIDQDYRSRLAALNLVFFGKSEGGGGTSKPLPRPR